jgi:hypothetical protein
MIILKTWRYNKKLIYLIYWYHNYYFQFMTNIIYIKKHSKDILINSIYQSGIVELIKQYGASLHKNSNSLFGLNLKTALINNYMKSLAMNDPYTIPQLDYKETCKIVMKKKYPKITNELKHFDICNKTKKIIKEFIEDVIIININISFLHETKKCNMLDLHISTSKIKIFLTYYFSF